MFEFLKQQKVKSRKTGNVVTIIDYHCESDKRRKTDWVSYIDSNSIEHEKVSGMNLFWDFEDVKEDYQKRERERAYYNHLAIFAGMIMQGLMSNNNIETINSPTWAEYLSDLSVSYAIRLCAKLDGINVEDLMKDNKKSK